MPAATDPRKHPAAPGGNAAQRLALAALLVSAWLASRQYAGVAHDGVVYALLALIESDPSALGRDLFVSHASQGDFSVYPWLLSRLIAAAGMQPASLILTALANLLALWAAWSLAGRMGLGRTRVLGLLLLLVAPGYYGAENIFRYLEPFATPRTAAEACVFAAIAIALAPSRRPLAWAALAASLAAGFALHPLIALPGALVCLVLLAVQHGRGLSPRASIPAAAALACAAIAFAASLERMDAAWLTQVRDAVPYAFLAEWSLLDWQRTVVPLCTLLYAARALQPAGPAWRVATASLAVGLLGLAVAWIGADVLAIGLVVQGQAWRWLWVAKAVAVLALAPALVAGWRAGGLLRIAGVLLGIAWLGIEDGLGMPAALLAVLLAVMARGGPGRSAVRGAIAWSIPAIALVLVARVSSLLDELLLLAGYAALAWAVLDRRPLLIAGGAVIVAVLLGRNVAAALDDASRHQFDLSESRIASFEAFRDRIPPTASVLYPAGVNTLWLVLRRASYVSSEQATAGMFSRAAAAEITRRAHATSGLQPAVQTLRRDVPDRGSPARLVAPLRDRLCALPDLDFVIGHEPLPGSRLVHPALHPEPNLYLYPCRSGAGP